MTMHDEASHTRDESILGILKSLLFQVTDIFRQEVALAKAEVSEATSRLGRALGFLAVGLLLGLAAMIFVLLAAMYGLTYTMPIWAAALLVGGVIGVAALALIGKARRDLSLEVLVPTKTVRTIREDFEFAKEQINE